MDKILSLSLIMGSLVVGWLLGSWQTRRRDFMTDVVAFHEKFGLEYNGRPRVLPKDLEDFRIQFQQEEQDEYVAFRSDGRWYPEVITAQRLEKQLDALVDLAYVVLGTAYLQFGADVFREAWRRVQVANMAKVRKLKATDGHTDSGRAAAYDVVKPAGWTAPSHIDLVQEFEGRMD